MSTKIVGAERNAHDVVSNGYAVQNEKGIALVTALIITLVVFLLVASAWYATMRATLMSSPVYTDACAAADGSVQMAKDAINQVLVGDPVPIIFPSAFRDCLKANAFTINASCNGQLPLPGTMGNFTADVTVTQIFSGTVKLATVRFPPVSMGNTNASFFRIVTVVTGPANTKCENAVVYRNVQ